MSVGFLSAIALNPFLLTKAELRIAVVKLALLSTKRGSVATSKRRDTDEWVTL